MWLTIGRKLATAWVTLTAAALLVSSIIYLMPADPARLTMGQRADAMSIAQQKTAMGLDQSPLPRIVSYLNDISPLSIYHAGSPARAEVNGYTLLTVSSQQLVLKLPWLRTSFQTGESVSSILWAALLPTAVLACFAMAIGLSLGILLGIIAATQANRPADRLITFLSAVGVAVPSYVSALAFALVFGVMLHHLTGLPHSGGLWTIDDFGNSRLALHHVLLPALALGIRPVAQITQLLRNALLDTLQQDYIRTALAKGLSPAQVLFRHALRPALQPVITAASGWFASLLTGAYFVEAVFNYDGLGSVTVEALRAYDVPLAVGAVLFAALVFIIVNLLTDTLQHMLDPRIRRKS